MGPKACANEIVASAGNLKAMVEQVLNSGGDYIIFTTQELNHQQKQDRIAAIRGKLNELGLPNFETASIDIYDASTIKGWANHYPSAITAILNWIGKPLVPGLLTWSEWERYKDFSQFEYIEDEERQKSIKSLKELLAQSRKCGRVIGMSGLGKTRLALELCRDADSQDGFSSQIVYFDAKHRDENLTGLVNNWV